MINRNDKINDKINKKIKKYLNVFNKYIFLDGYNY